IQWDDFVGRVAVGRVLSGSVRPADTIYTLRKDGSAERVKITKLFTYSGLKTNKSEEGIAGDIIGLAGFDDVDIGETLAASATAERLPFMEIDPPTIEMEFSVNDGPFAGQDGKKVTSRQIRERLMREVKTNISIFVEDTDKGTH